MVSSDTPAAYAGASDGKKTRSGLSAWFGASLEEEFAMDASASRRNSNGQQQNNRVSPIAASQANKTRIRAVPLKRNSLEHNNQARPALGRLYRTPGQEIIAPAPPPPRPQAKRESSHRSEVTFDLHSEQSSITNSWAPKMRPYYPPQLFPHKPIENMVISIKSAAKQEEEAEQEAQGKGGDDTTNSTAISSNVVMNGSFPRKREYLHDVVEVDINDDGDGGGGGSEDESTSESHQQRGGVERLHQSIELTEEQKADVEQYVFRTWGDTDDECDDGGDGDDERELQENNNNRSSSWFFSRPKKEVEESTPSAPPPPPPPPPVVVHTTTPPEEEVLPARPRAESIDEAIRELQALTGMQVKCLDEASAKNLIPKSSGHTATTDNNADGELNKSGWFFTKQPTPLIKKDDDLAQPYALIRSQEDEERLKKHYEEAKRLREEEERKHFEEEERKKKRKSWFVFSKDEHEGDEKKVLDDTQIADAIDDLEIIAGEVRVSQLKEARLMQGDGGQENSTDVHPPWEASHRKSELHDSRSGRRFLTRGTSEDENNGALKSPDSHTPEMSALRKGMSAKHKKHLSRFELPLGDDDGDHTEKDGPPLNSIIGVNLKTSLSSNRLMMLNLKEETEIETQARKPRKLVGSSDSGSSDFDYEARLDDPSEVDESIPPPPKVSEIKKEALIVDQEKRDVRWRLNQMLVSNLFKSYHSAMAGADNLLPVEDDFQVYAEAEQCIEEQFQEVRNQMLEDGNLSEREVAAFFEGFALLTVKARSLQSQVEALKVTHRAEAEERKFQALEGELVLREDLVKEAPRLVAYKNMMNDPKISSESKLLLKQLEVSERKRLRLEKELLEQGVSLPEHVPYEDAKGKVDQIERKIETLRSDTRRLTSRKKAERDEELANLEATKEELGVGLAMQSKWESRESQWEDEVSADNLDSLKRIRRHMPLNVMSLNDNQMTIEKTPNGKLLPKRIAKKFKQTNILQLLRTHPDDVDIMHPSTLENLQLTGLTLSERRALHAHLKDLGPRWRRGADNEMVNRKWSWFRMLKQQFKEALATYECHCAEFGPPENHPYVSRADPTKGCPLIGRACPIKADKLFDYGIDYGFPDGPVYQETASSPPILSTESQEATESLRLKKARRRSQALKRHYKGAVLPFALANSCCEEMDKIMDRMEGLQHEWIEDRLSCKQPNITDQRRREEMGSFAAAVHELKLALPPFAERSGMQLTGSKSANADQPDGRSTIELGLCEEVWEHVDDFFTGIEFRFKELDVTDLELKAEINQLRDLMDELHDRNMTTINRMGVRYPEPSRKVIKRKDIERSIQQKLQDLEREQKYSHDEGASDPDAAAGTNKQAVASNQRNMPWDAQQKPNETLRIEETFRLPTIQSDDSLQETSERLQSLTSSHSRSSMSRGSAISEDSEPEVNEADAVVSLRSKGFESISLSHTAPSEKASNRSYVRPTPTGAPTADPSPAPQPASVPQQATIPVTTATPSVVARTLPSAYDVQSNTEEKETPTEAPKQKPPPVEAPPKDDKVSKTREKLEALKAKISNNSYHGSATFHDSFKAELASKTKITSTSLHGSSTSFKLGMDDSGGKSATSRDFDNKTSGGKSATARDADMAARMSAIRERIAAGKSPARERFGKSPGRERLGASAGGERFGTSPGRERFGKSPARERFGKSPARERIAAGKSPARERIAAGKSPARERMLAAGKNPLMDAAEASERMAAIEERREKMRASIAARKKAREELAASKELKLDD